MDQALANAPVKGYTGLSPELSRSWYTLREAAGLAGLSLPIFRKRMRTLYRGDTWYVTFGKQKRVPRGALTLYFDRGGLACPWCRRRYSTPWELRKKDTWRG